jgi:hypothetical protein
MRKINFSACVLAAAITAAALAGCTNKQPPAPQPSTTATATGVPSMATATQPAPLTPETASQQAIAAYLGMQNAFQAASRAGDPSYPDLGKYGTGDALALYTDALNRAKEQGLLGRGQALFYPKVTALAPPAAPTKVSIEDCMDTSATSRYKANGEPFNDSPGGRRLVFADVELRDGVWKVFSLAVRSVGSCTG